MRPARHPAVLDRKIMGSRDVDEAREHVWTLFINKMKNAVHDMVA